jgi:hypothetical protein
MSLTSLPDQTISEPLKTKEWHMEHAVSYARYSITDNYNEQRKDILKYYRGYNAELDDKERKLANAIERPHGSYLGVEYIVYPLIQSKIEQIVGEFIQRPLRRKAYVLDKKSKNKKFDEKLNMLAEEMMREVTKKLQGDLGFTPETKNPQMQIPEDIEEHDFKTVAEEIADGLINIFLDVRKEKSKFKQLFTDYCISDRAHVVIEKKQGFTSARKVHPLDCDYDIDPYKVVQDDHEYFFENYYLTENEIYNTFPKLTRKEKKEVAEMFLAISDTDSTTNESQELGNSQKYDGFVQTSNKVHRMRLISAMWKSRKRVSVKVSESDYGEFYKKLDPDYKERDNDKIEYLDGDMPRFVLMLGPEMCLDYGVMEKRFSSVDDPFRCSLPVVSIVRDNTIGSSLIKSIAAKLYQLQSMASEILFEIRVALKSAGDSRVLVYDAAQTPKEFSKGGYETGLNRVMHHIKKDKLMIINSKDKGAQASGGGFNQFTSLDLSQKGVVQDLFNGLAIIEDLAAKFSGMSPEREGQVGEYQTATGTDRAIRGSAARTEIIFTPFDEFLQSLIEKVVLAGKHHYEKGEVIHYIFGEMKTKFLTLFDDFFVADFGIYLSDARKDKEASERIDRAAEMALSNSNTPEMVLGLIEVFEGDSANEKKKVFKRLLDAMEKTRAESEKAMQEIEANKLAADAEDKDKNRGISREGFQKDKDVALIYKDGKAQDGARKNISQERMKVADIEQKDRASQNKN